MSQFPADDLPRLFVFLTLYRCQCLAGRPTRCGRFPSRQRFVAILGVLMAQPVHIAQTHLLALTVVDMALIDVALVRWNQ